MAIRERKQKKGSWTLVLMLLAICAVLLLFICLPSEIWSGDGSAAPEAQTETPAAETDEQADLQATTLVKEGMEAPDFTVEFFDGSQLKLSALRGRVVLLNFWATWCPPCREELTRVQAELIDRFAGRPFTFLPVSRGEERSDVAAFREKTGYTFPMGLDPGQTIYNLYASNYIPRNFLIDTEGRVVLATVGYEPEEFDALVARIDALLGGQE